MANRKFVIYGCGGMSLFGKDRFEESDGWRRKLKEEFEQIEDVLFVNPNTHFNLMDDSTYKSEREIMEFDIYKVRNADLIIVNFNDPRSIGSACEIAIAYERRIPIIGFNENNMQLHPWLECFCNRIFDNMNDLIAYVKQHYINGD